MNEEERKITKGMAKIFLNCENGLEILKEACDELMKESAMKSEADKSVAYLETSIGISKLSLEFLKEKKYNGNTKGRSSKD